MTVFFILLYIIYAVSLFFIHIPSVIIVTGLPVVIAYCLLPKIARSGLLLTLIFGLFIFVANLLSPSGEIIFKKGHIIIGKLSLEMGFERAIRLILLVMTAKVLLWKFHPDEILKGIERLLGPLGKAKIVQDFIETSLLTIKVLPGVKKELLRLYSENCKCGSLIERLKAISLIIVSVLVKAVHAPEEFF